MPIDTYPIIVYYLVIGCYSVLQPVITKSERNDIHMQINITQLYANTTINYAKQESLRRRMSLVLCKFQNRYAYILVSSNTEARLLQDGRFTVVVQTTDKIPLMKQHMQLQMTGRYQTHKTAVHHYTATVLDVNSNTVAVYRF